MYKTAPKTPDDLESYLFQCSNRSPYFIAVRQAMRARGHWKALPRGNPRKGMAVAKARARRS